MATIMIGYDLNKPQQNYDPLIEKIKSLGAWWHHLDSTWLVVCNQTATQVRDALSSLIDENDELLVVDVTGDARAWTGFNQSASKWLKETYK